MKIRPVKPFFHNDDIDYILDESRNILSGKGKLLYTITFIELSSP